MSESILNNIAEPDDDDQNNDNDNNHDYEYVNDNNVAIAQKANDNELIVPACPTCPRKKNQLQDVANVANDNINNNDYNDNDNDDNDKRTNTNAPIHSTTNAPIHSMKRKQMNSMSSKSRKKSVTSIMSRRELVAYTANVMKNLPPANNGTDNLKYLQGYKSARLTPPDYRAITKSAINVARVGGVKDLVMGDPLVGAIVMPEFGVIIPALAMNDNLYVDFHAMAQSPCDGTPPTAHMVLTEENVNDLHDYLSVGNMHLEWFQPNDFVTTEVDNVEMPETPTLKRSWVVDCLVVKQIADSKSERCICQQWACLYTPPRTCQIQVHVTNESPQGC